MLGENQDDLWLRQLDESLIELRSSLKEQSDSREEMVCIGCTTPFSKRQQINKFHQAYSSKISSLLNVIRKLTELYCKDFRSMSLGSSSEFINFMEYMVDLFGVRNDGHTKESKTGESLSEVIVSKEKVEQVMLEQLHESQCKLEETPICFNTKRLEVPSSNSPEPQTPTCHPQAPHPSPHINPIRSSPFTPSNIPSVSISFKHFSATKQFPTSISTSPLSLMLPSIQACSVVDSPSVKRIARSQYR